MGRVAAGKSSGLPRKTKKLKQEEKGTKGKRKRKLAGGGDSLSWIFREEAEERTEDFSGEKTEEMRRRERYDIYHGS